MNEESRRAADALEWRERRERLAYYKAAKDPAGFHKAVIEAALTMFRR
jgi:hypothetical protein